jgi:hypothetical protein
MTSRASCHAVVLLAALLAGCASRQQNPVATVGGAPQGGGIQVDPTRCNPAGKQVVTADVDGDKKPDVTKLYETREVNGQKVQILACKQVDLNHDEKIDIVYHYDQNGVLTFEEFDLDFDGRFETWTYYQGGQKVREDRDINYDGRPDLSEYYEGGRKVRVEVDSNHDGKIDQWEYYENGKLDRIGYDTTGQGRADKWDRAPEDLSGGATSNAEAAAAGTAPAPPPPPAVPGAAPTAPAPAKK